MRPSLQIPYDPFGLGRSAHLLVVGKMSERFSPALRSTDLNDFIAPSQACIVSLKGAKSAVKPEHPENLSHQLPPSQIERVQINLHDCLACSGCITSAETVMLQQQSLEEFLSHLESKEKCVIVSISPQSRASLANYFGLSPLQVHRKLTGFFKSLGVKAVFDTSCSRDLSLIESCHEFIARYKQHHLVQRQDGPLLPMLSSACPAISRGASVDVIASLLQSKDAVNWRDNFGVTPLMEAIKRGERAIVDLLIKEGARLHCDDVGSFLCKTTSDGDLNRLNLALACPDVDRNAKSYSGRTALHVAARKGETSLVRALLKGKHPADVHLKDRWGFTAVNEAKYYQHDDVVHLLESYCDV